MSCSQTGHEKAVDNSTSGTIRIGADHEFMPLTAAELNVFMYLYTDAHIHPYYETEDSVFNLLLKDSVRLIVASRKLSPQEEVYFHSRKLFPEQVKIASDAVTFIVNNNNPDTLISVDELKAVFAGHDSLWQQLNPKSVPGKMAVVFDYENSANALYIHKKLMHGQKFPSFCFALHGNRQVINYVGQNKNALGIIGGNWISDGYDTTVIRELTSIKVVALASKNSATPGDYYKPWAEYIQTGQYPLCRNIYIISREAYTGLGSGFLSFVTSDKGQRIVFRAGLLPAIMPNQNMHF